LETLTNSSSLNFRLLSCAVLNIFYNLLWKKAMEEGKKFTTLLNGAQRGRKRENLSR
jgi:hypothetical protein